MIRDILIISPETGFVEKQNNYIGEQRIAVDFIFILTDEPVCSTDFNEASTNLW